MRPSLFILHGDHKKVQSHYDTQAPTLNANKRGQPVPRTITQSFSTRNEGRGELPLW